MNYVVMRKDLSSVLSDKNGWIVLATLRQPPELQRVLVE